MNFIGLIVLLVVVGLLLWAVTQLPLDPAIQKLIRVLVIVVAVLYVVAALFGAASLPTLRLNL